MNIPESLVVDRLPGDVRERLENRKTALEAGLTLQEWKLEGQRKKCEYTLAAGLIILATALIAASVSLLIQENPDDALANRILSAMIPGAILTAAGIIPLGSITKVEMEIKQTRRKEMSKFIADALDEALGLVKPLEEEPQHLSEE